MLTKLIIWFIMRYLRWYARKHHFSSVFIEGVGKDYPNYLLFSHSEEFNKAMKKLYREGEL